MGWEQGQSKAVQYISPTDLRHIVDCLPDPLLVADTRGLIRFANPASAGLFDNPLEQYIGAQVPFSPDDARVRLRVKGRELDLLLRWARTHWEGNAAWLVTARAATGQEPVARAKSESGEDQQAFEHRAVQAELRNEQLQEQLHRLQEQLSASDDLRHEQQVLLEQRNQALHEVQEQVDYSHHRARQLEQRAQEAEGTALEQWNQSEERRRELEHRLQASTQQLSQLEGERARLEAQIQEASQRVGPPTQMERQLEQAHKRFSEQLARIQMLEAELEGLRERAVPRDEGAWDDMRLLVF